jgi:hypothetical protein
LISQTAGVENKFMKDSRRRFPKIAAGALLPIAFFGRSICAQAPTNSPASNTSLVAAVRNLGSQFLENRVGVTGADGATSLLLPSGDSLWMFGDTVEGPFKSIRELELTGLRSNTAAVVPKQDVSEGIKEFSFLADDSGRRPRQIVPFAGDENPAVHRVWPIHGVTVGGDIFLFYHRITLLKGVDVFANFQLDGMGIARGELGKFNFTRLIAPDGSREFWKGKEPTFGVFAQLDDEHLYLWGSLTTGMFLARTRPNAVDKLSSYEYLVEAPDLKNPERVTRWSKTFRATAMLFDSVPNEMSASFNAYLQKYVAFHSLHRENKIVMRTAERITGPWSEAHVAYRPEKSNDSDLIYAAKEHPELAREGGRILYVTFVNSATYIPQLIEVQLK